MAPNKAAFGLATRTIAACAALVVGGGLAFPASAQTFPNLPISPAQRATAQQVAQAGVPLSELAPDAPDSYTVKSGDTLWAISGKFLKSPWRWPELWGMNMEEVRNPHLIFPGQTLYLEKVGGMARLRTTPPGTPEGGIPTVRVSPRTRIAGVQDSGIPALPPRIIEPFLTESIIIDNADELEHAPRIVAGPDDHVLLTRGDRAYARGRLAPVVESDPHVTDQFRIFRNAVPLRDASGRILGYEGKYLGAAELVRNEQGVQAIRTTAGTENALIPATIDIKRAKEEIQVGDRLMPEPARLLASYVPHAPRQAVDAAIISVYGDAVELIGQSSVVALSVGAVDGIDSGTVLAIQKAGAFQIDRSPGGDRARMKLPDERAGLLMVFRTFDRLSYALVLEVNQPVRVGDRVIDPR